jgi:hypothetical protein
MKAFLGRRIVIAATVLCVLGGGAAAAAVAATTSSSGTGEQAYLADLATRLNVTPSALGAAIKATDSDQINAALAAGKLTSAEAATLRQRLAQSTNAPLLGAGLGDRRFGGRRFGGRGLGGRGLLGLDAIVTNYLGISSATLRSDLAAGQSLATIANAGTTGRSADGLSSAITAAETSRLTAAVSSGKLTSAQEQRRLTSLSSRISALLSRVWTGAGRFGGRAWGARGAAPSTGATGLFGATPTA